jgi:hypothetical protein
MVSECVRTDIKGGSQVISRSADCGCEIVKKESPEEYDSKESIAFQ